MPARPRAQAPLSLGPRGGLQRLRRLIKSNKRVFYAKKSAAHSAGSSTQAAAAIAEARSGAAIAEARCERDSLQREAALAAAYNARAAAAEESAAQILAASLNARAQSLAASLNARASLEAYFKEQLDTEKAISEICRLQGRIEGRRHGYRRGLLLGGFAALVQVLSIMLASQEQVTWKTPLQFVSFFVIAADFCYSLWLEKSKKT